jgi:hypothetical protein
MLASAPDGDANSGAGRYDLTIAIAAIGVAAIVVAVGAVVNHIHEIGSMAEDAFLEALAALEAALAENQRRATLIRRRIAQLRRLRSGGASYAEIVSKDGPLIVQLLTESSATLDTSGANVRRAEARALYAEGLTMEQIAERFGVTRQRVSILLRKARE